MATIKGIDTSKWQNNKVDYKKAKNAGYDFVILRIGYNTTKDKCFEKDYINAINAGMKVGVYFYTLATTVKEAEYDASRVLGWLNNRHLDLPIAYDVEDAKQKKNSKSMNSNIYNAFANKIKKANYECMLYTGESYFNTYFNKNTITDAKKWIAKYSTKKPNIGTDYIMWQYTSNAISNDFYKDKLDRNYYYGTFNSNNNSTKVSNPYTEPTRNLKRIIPNMSGDDVRWVQWELIEKGFLFATNSKGKTNIDGKYGSGTKDAVMKYQKAHSLKVDGIVGSATRYAMKND